MMIINMAATNAAIVQANNALKKLNTGANAQVAAEAGQNVSANLKKMNGSYNAAANGFRGVANKLNGLNLKGAANSFKAAANAAEAAGAARAARNAASGLNKIKNAVTVNITKMNNGQAVTNGAGVA
jgi:hypothetical protein